LLKRLLNFKNTPNFYLHESFSLFLDVLLDLDFLSEFNANVLTIENEKDILKKCNFLIEDVSNQVNDQKDQDDQDDQDDKDKHDDNYIILSLFKINLNYYIYINEKENYKTIYFNNAFINTIIRNKSNLILFGFTNNFLKNYFWKIKT
jgi:hypothetical protein